MATNNVNLKHLDQIDPDITILKQILENSDSKIDPRLIDAIYRKISALTTTPTTIEKTMSPYQLYQSKNILWAKNLPAKIIQYMIDAEEKLKYISEKDFEEICKCRNNLYFQNFIENQKLSQTT